MYVCEWLNKKISMMIKLLMELPSDNIVWLQHIGISWEILVIPWDHKLIILLFCKVFVNFSEYVSN